MVIGDGGNGSRDGGSGGEHVAAEASTEEVATTEEEAKETAVLLPPRASYKRYACRKREFRVERGRLDAGCDAHLVAALVWHAYSEVGQR